jgi:hypothetical protein
MVCKPLRMLRLDVRAFRRQVSPSHAGCGRRADGHRRHHRRTRLELEHSEAQRLIQLLLLTSCPRSRLIRYTHEPATDIERAGGGAAPTRTVLPLRQFRH